MSYQSISRSDGVSFIAAVTVVLFLLTATWAIREKHSEIRRVAAKFSASRSVPHVRVRGEKEALWDRGEGRFRAVPPPPAAYQLPQIRRSLGAWHKADGAVESWGFVTQCNAQEVGVDVLNHYETLKGWRLARSEPLGLFAESWGCAVYRMQTREVVMVTALPERLGEAPGGKANLTRVSIVRMAGEEALRDVLGDFDRGK